MPNFVIGGVSRVYRPARVASTARLGTAPPSLIAIAVSNSIDSKKNDSGPHVNLGLTWTGGSVIPTQKTDLKEVKAQPDEKWHMA